MLKIKPNYIVEGCPVEVSNEIDKKKRVLYFYGLKPYLRSSLERFVFQAKRNKSRVTVFYWESFFIKKENIYFKVNVFKTHNIEDLNHELSGSIHLNKQVNNNSISFQKNILEQPERPSCGKFENPVLKINNQKLFKSRPVIFNLDKTKTFFHKKILNIEVLPMSMNRSLDSFRKEYIKKHNL